MAERLGERYGVPVHETPVGFKYVGPRMIETGAMMGGEESGGFGFGMHLPERDGIYTDLLLLDLFLREQAAGRWPVSKAIAHLHEIAGPSFYQRVDVHVDRDAYPALKDRLLVDLSGTRRRRSPVSRSPGPTRSRPTTGSSSSPATARGCSCASAARSRSSASTPRRARRTLPTRSSVPAKRSSAANDGNPRSR